jgi:hypothetical protein
VTRASEAALRPAPEPAPVERPAEQSVAAVAAERPRKVSGSVLGLPSTASSAPMVFGERPCPDDEAGIGALTNYGKDPYAGGGHGGTIALVVAVLLIAGAILAYLYVPSVHSKVDELVARVRNRGQEPPPPVAKPRAMLFMPRVTVVKNMVKVQGDVINSDPAEPIEAPIHIDVPLERRDGSALEMRSVPVKPEPLAPGQKGVYEFEYDGRAYRGIIVTKSKLYSNGQEVVYATPQKN